VIVGDLVIGVPPGELSTYPDEVIDDKAELQRSAARLLDYEFDALLLCDGQPLPSGGKEKLRDFVKDSGHRRSTPPSRFSPRTAVRAGRATTA
jgi:hypothetical protein